MTISYFVNLNNGEIRQVKLNTGETFKIDTAKNIVVNEFEDDFIHVVFYRRRTVYS